MNFELFICALLIGISFISWISCHMFTEFKYLWCKGKCEKCYNWKCKYFQSDYDSLLSDYYELCKEYDLAMQELAELKKEK